MRAVVTPMRQCNFRHHGPGKEFRMAERNLGKSVGNLLLALLNATLILAALCLWLAWSALAAAERVSGQIEEAASTVLPLRTEIASLTEEVAAARIELATFRSDGASGVATLQQRMAGVEAELASLTDVVAALDANPEALIDRAVISAFDGLGAAVAEILTALRGGSAEPGA
jgi:hypothetical protein